MHAEPFDKLLTKLHAVCHSEVSFVLVVAVTT